MSFRLFPLTVINAMQIKLSICFCFLHLLFSFFSESTNLHATSFIYIFLSPSSAQTPATSLLLIITLLLFPLRLLLNVRTKKEYCANRTTRRSNSLMSSFRLMRLPSTWLFRANYWWLQNTLAMPATKVSIIKTVSLHYPRDTYTFCGRPGVRWAN